MEFTELLILDCRVLETELCAPSTMYKVSNRLRQSDRNRRCCSDVPRVIRSLNGEWAWSLAHGLCIMRAHLARWKGSRKRRQKTLDSAPISLRCTCTDSPAEEDQIPDTNALFPPARHLLPPTNTCAASYEYLLPTPTSSTFLGALSRDFRPRNPFTQDFHPRRSPHPQVFIPTSIYGQPVRSRLEWWIQLDEQFAYAPTLLLPLHISRRGLLNPSMESPSVPTVHGTPLAKIPFQKSLGQSVSLCQALHSLSSKPSSKRRPRWTRSIFSGGWPKRVAGLRSIEQTSLVFPRCLVHGSRWSSASLEDDLIQGLSGCQ
jgi:hypothetical protein